MSSPLISQHGVAILGAGPVGLAAAAHLLARGISSTIFEAGDAVGTNFREVAHVPLFSSWRYNVDLAARKLLETRGWAAPDPEGLPTAGELVDRYLEPLGAALATQIRLGSRVLAVTRVGMDKVKSTTRDEAPFVVRVAEGAVTRDHLAGAVIDATGTWGNPNPLGANGLMAMDEEKYQDRIAYGIPDVLGRDRARYEGKTVLVVGAGHSAANALLSLAALARADGQMRLHWAVRGSNLRRVFGGGDADQLPARGALGRNLQELIRGGQLVAHTEFRIEELALRDGALVIVARTPQGIQELSGIDEIICATGSRPSLQMTRELRVRLDPWLESVDALAPLIDPNEHSCGSVRPHGHRELAHPEPGFYVVGAKSYGRAPTFLMATGYEQVRSIAAALAGDLAAADSLQLQLPETGVCGTSVGKAAAKSGCCGPASSGLEAKEKPDCCGPARAEPEARRTSTKASGCCPPPAESQVTEPAQGCCS